jgi:hypothetical protein
MSHLRAIPFRPEFEPAILSGEKDWTTRSKPYGSRGDRVLIFGHEFELRHVLLVPLAFVAEVGYAHEGFESPEGFIECWCDIHPVKGYKPDEKHYLHVFRRVVDAPDGNRVRTPGQQRHQGAVQRRL